MTDDIDPETLSLLREQLRENPEAIIRAYPDRARNLADRARAAGHTGLGDRIDELVDSLTVDA